MFDQKRQRQTPNKTHAHSCGDISSLLQSPLPPPLPLRLGFPMSLSLSITLLVIIISCHLLAFVFAVGAERRRSVGEVVHDQYDEYSYCAYDTDASTVYGLCAFGLLLVSQTVVNGVTKCFCFGKGLMPGRFKTIAVFFYVFSWLNFLAAEACLLGGSARNAYHTKYQVLFGTHLSCATLRKGVFAAAAALILLSMMASVVYYWAHSRADTGGWEKHQDEGLAMTGSDASKKEANAFPTA